MRLVVALAVVAIGCGGDPFNGADPPEAGADAAVALAASHVDAGPSEATPEAADPPPEASAAIDATEASSAPQEALDAGQDVADGADAADASAAPRCGTVTTCALEFDCLIACGQPPSGERWYCTSDTNQPPSCDLRLSDAGLWPLDGAYQTP